MTNQKLTVRPDFFELTHCATSVLDRKREDIESKFSSVSPYLISPSTIYSNNDMLEIRFDKECATLCCTFDGDNRCDISYLFWDEDSTISEYIDYVNGNFSYDYLASRWVMLSASMSIKRADGIISFLFFRKLSDLYPNW